MFIKTDFNLGIATKLIEPAKCLKIYFFKFCFMIIFQIYFNLKTFSFSTSLLICKILFLLLFLLILFISNLNYYPKIIRFLCDTL